MRIFNHHIPASSAFYCFAVLPLSLSSPNPNIISYLGNYQCLAPLLYVMIDGFIPKERYTHTHKFYFSLSAVCDKYTYVCECARTIAFALYIVRSQITINNGKSFMVWLSLISLWWFANPKKGPSLKLRTHANAIRCKHVYLRARTPAHKNAFWGGHSRHVSAWVGCGVSHRPCGIYWIVCGKSWRKNTVICPWSWWWNNSIQPIKISNVCYAGLHFMHFKCYNFKFPPF